MKILSIKKLENLDISNYNNVKYVFLRDVNVYKKHFNIIS